MLLLPDATGRPIHGIYDHARFPDMGRPDMTSAVDWALKANSLSIPDLDLDAKS